MTVSPETLIAFIDGELSPEEARRVAAEVANDPALAAHTEKHRALKARLQAASVPPPAPADAAASAGPLGPAAGSSAKAEETTVARIPKAMGWVPASAMAAGIALGLLLAVSFRPGTDMRTDGGKATAQGALARVLSSQLVAEPDGAKGTTRIGESFFSNDGYFCRDFTTSDNASNALAGVACREGQDWRIRALAAATSGEAEKAPELPDSVRTAVSSMIVGKPLDEEGERAARAQGWLVK